MCTDLLSIEDMRFTGKMIGDDAHGLVILVAQYCEDNGTEMGNSSREIMVTGKVQKSWLADHPVPDNNASIYN